MAFNKMVFGKKLVLKDVEGFLANSGKQGAESLLLAEKIAKIGFVRVFGMGKSESGVTLVDTGIAHGDGNTIGLSQEEMKYFEAEDAEI